MWVTFFFLKVTDANCSHPSGYFHYKNDKKGLIQMTIIIFGVSFLNPARLAKLAKLHGIKRFVMLTFYIYHLSWPKGGEEYRDLSNPTGPLYKCSKSCVK